ncbi:hypothetical protein NQ318_014677, partial [Aromia moschata]
ELKKESLLKSVEQEMETDITSPNNIKFISETEWEQVGKGSVTSVNNNVDKLNLENVDNADKDQDIELEIERRRKLRKKQRLEAKRLAEEESLRKRKEKALKGMKYLLGLSEKYSAFFKEKVFSEAGNSKKAKGTKPLQERNKLQPTLRDMKEVVNVDNRKSGGKKYADISKHLKYFEGGTLRPYQIDGVTWMTVLYENGLNGILADEMGLGKTIQVIALICHLLERNTSGPYVIVAPLSTLPNWEAEFRRFAPKVPVVVFHGHQLERISQYKQIKKKYTLGDMQTRPVVLTSYQMPLMEEHFLRQFEWQYIIIDEGHRIKNHESKLSKVLRSFNSANRLLLTGTPLQNNITELWALLNFLLPHIFNNMDTFAALLMVEDVQDENKLLEEEQKNNLISTIHKVLTPFMLRRLKKDVLNDMVPKKEVNIYCPLSPLQRDLYSYVINKNIAKLRGESEQSEKQVNGILDQPRTKRKCTYRRQNYVETEDDDFSDYEDYVIAKEEQETGQKLDKKLYPFITRLTMQNPMIMFKKIVNHPFLVHFPLDPSKKTKQLLVNEEIITSSGKMMVLDKLLPKLKKRGHKVLIFSTLVMTLDFIEEYMIMRNHNYRRLDGQHSLAERGKNISDFNNDPDILAFLISTRAGGLGLNLTGADTVIFFDRDWNPQVDIQAQDRCHRIGQTKPVVVYTLITKNTIDDRIISCGQQKRLLEKIVIKDGKFKMLNDADKNKVENELKELQDLLNNENQSQDGHDFSGRHLDMLLNRSDLFKLMKEKQKNT